MKDLCLGDTLFILVLPWRCGAYPGRVSGCQDLGALAAVSAVAIGFSAVASAKDADEGVVPVMGVAAAFIFAA